MNTAYRLLLVTSILLFSCSSILFSQHAETIEFYSRAFETSRKIVVHTPEFFKYQSEEVKLPLYIVLDGQHEWFVKPTISTLEYLMYTKEIPPGIIVEVPLSDRVAECGIPDDGDTTLPLHKLITKEIHEQLQDKYPTNGFNLLIGHSFSASFSLYSLAQSPEFYAAVFAHSPLDEIEKLITWLNLYSVGPEKVFLSVGGTHQSKDKYHRQEIERVKTLYPAYFEQIEFYSADFSAHNAVPIVSNPIFLTKLFEKYSYRFTHIAEVDMNYQLKEFPGEIEEELKKIKSSSIFRNIEFSVGLADFNGIASRYSTDERFIEHAIAIYELGTEMYPEYFEYYIYLAEAYLESDKPEAKRLLSKGKLLLNTHESNSEDYEYFIDYINDLMKLIN